MFRFFKRLQILLIAALVCVVGLMAGLALAGPASGAFGVPADAVEVAIQTVEGEGSLSSAGPASSDSGSSHHQLPHPESPTDSHDGEENESPRLQEELEDDVLAIVLAHHGRAHLHESPTARAVDDPVFEPALGGLERPPRG